MSKEFEHVDTPVLLLNLDNYEKNIDDIASFAKVGEAEIMVAGGIKDILIAYPLAAKAKQERVKKLMGQAKLL